MASSNSKNHGNRPHYDYRSMPERGSAPHGVGSHRFGSEPPEQGSPERRRRSSFLIGSLGHRPSLYNITHAGGVNSLDNFARSWQRAAGFWEITPAPDMFEQSEAEEGETETFDEESSIPHSIEDDDELDSHWEDLGGRPDGQGTPRSERSSDLFAVPPHLGSPFSASYGTSYGTLSRVNEASMNTAGRLWREQQAAGVQKPDKEREPLLVKRVEREDGKFVNVVVGQSTLPQTVFNSINVLVGVGLLSLPLALKYSGWLVGMIFLLVCAIVTSYTARLLAKCLNVDATLVTFADLAYISFGQNARIITSIMFTIELLGTNVALVVLFSDSLNALIPGLGVLAWKIICGILLVPLGFLPLRVLSISSVVGIMCCMGIVIAILLDGLIKRDAPGSLWEPATTYLFPDNWLTIPLSFGLLIAPWGGHSVFPNIYRDMRHPKKYDKGLGITYVSTYLLDVGLAIVGYLMFGESVREEVTANILTEEGYPKWISVCIVVFIAIIPLTKIPLNARPIISTIEILSGLDVRTIPASQMLMGTSGFTRGFLKVAVRVLTTVVFVAIAIAFPYFDSIMAFLGSAMCFTICVVLPAAFHLKIFGNQISLKERIFNWALIIIFGILAVVGTVWAFLPRDRIGAV